ncbi:hypothetical protein GALL_493030 [mine drainage metagenome]|uniref:Uncharacterized protein n=1 Tax=mine drainage metagenome TaxID=410659 RepID=A0A1J5PCZ5_9ZZZZ
MVPATKTPISTPAVTAKSPVASSTRKIMVKGAPMIAVPTAPMPTSMKAERSPRMPGSR